MSSIDEGSRASAADLKRYLHIIATALHAPAWCCLQSTLTVDEPVDTWSWTTCDELSHMDEGGALSQLNTLPGWRPKLLFSALYDLSEIQTESLSKPRSLCWPSEAMVAEGQEQLLGWMAVGEDLVGYCFVYERSDSSLCFTSRDATVLRMLADELLYPSVCMGSPAQVCPQPELSPRQQDVLDRLLLGLAVKEIARDLQLSPHTVNDYVRALYKRYGVSSRGELLAVVHGHRRAERPVPMRGLTRFA